MKEGKDTALGEWLTESVSEMHVTEIKPVQRWMQDLRMMTESECMCILQAKPIRSTTSDLAKITINTKGVYHHYVDKILKCNLIFRDC